MRLCCLYAQAMQACCQVSRSHHVLLTAPTGRRRAINLLPGCLSFWLLRLGHGRTVASIQRSSDQLH